MRTVIQLRCETCWREFSQEMREYRGRMAQGCRRSYCSQQCSGLARSRNRPVTERKQSKALYDRLYRLRDPEALKERKRLYHCMTYDPDEARRARRKLAAKHAEYIRRYYADPDNKAAKVAYDQERRAAEYGDFADAYRLLLELQREIIARSPDKYERLKARGYYNESRRERVNQRRREIYQERHT